MELIMNISVVFNFLKFLYKTLKIIQFIQFLLMMYNLMIYTFKIIKWFTLEALHFIVFFYNIFKFISAPLFDITLVIILF